jgi:hypothetical protein
LVCVDSSALDNGTNDEDHYSQVDGHLSANPIGNRSIDQGISMLFAGRAIAGLAVGQLTMVVPLYISEVSIPEIGEPYPSLGNNLHCCKTTSPPRISGMETSEMYRGICF